MGPASTPRPACSTTASATSATCSSRRGPARSARAEWRGLWNLDATLPIDCDECFGPDGGGISNLALYLAAKHPEQRFAPGIGHTITSGPGFYTTEVDDIRLVDWLAAVLAGETSHVSP